MSAATLFHYPSKHSKYFQECKLSLVLSPAFVIKPLFSLILNVISKWDNIFSRKRFLLYNVLSTENSLLKVVEDFGFLSYYVLSTENSLLKVVEDFGFLSYNVLSTENSLLKVIFFLALLKTIAPLFSDFGSPTTLTSLLQAPEPPLAAPFV